MGADGAGARYVARPAWFPPDAEPLLEELEKVVPVVGSGISRGANLDDGQRLADWMRGLSISAGVAVPAGRERDCFAVADEVVGSSSDRARQLRLEITAHLDLAARAFSLTDTLKAIVHAPSRLVLTYNYDLLIEAAADHQGIDYASLTQDDINELQPIIRGEVPDRLVILHLHGSVLAPESIVLDYRTYHRQINSGQIERLFASLAYTHTFLFLGLGMREPYMLAWFEQLELAVPRHIFVCDEEAARETNVSPRRHGIVAAVFPAGRYASVDELTQSVFGAAA